MHNFNYDNLSDDNKINYNIIQNQLQSTIWYIDTFKLQQRDPSSYNLGGECYYIITQPYAPLTERLQTLSKHIQHANEYYLAAEKIINRPTKEYTQLAIQQNQGSLDVFGASLTDSIKSSSLSPLEKDSLQQRITATVSAIKNYISFLQKNIADKNYAFSNFKTGTTYYNVADLSKMPAADAESELREYNTYSLQFLSLHEAMPGHCMQGVYNKKSGSIIKSVFGNGAMIEGWAVYCEQMMMENGWGNDAPELWLVLYKWRLRECSNVLYFARGKLVNYLCAQLI